jgi:short-subunit dehydrogenase
MVAGFNAKVIVITGASSGFGKGAALEFARRGARLVLGARREDALAEVVRECRALGAQAIAVPTDVARIGAVQNLADTAVKEFGSIDVWVNAAGAAAVGFFTDVPLVEHMQVIETDLMGTMYGSYLAIKQFLLQESGTLINIASMIGKIPAPYYASYAAAKHGVVGLSAALRQELTVQKMPNLHVCTVLPMAMDTPFFEHAANYTGHQTVPIPPLDDANKVVDVIVGLALVPQDEVPVGMGGGTNLLLHNTSPAMSEAIMGQLTHKAQMEDAPFAAPTPGAVRQPAKNGNGTGVKDPKLAKK